MTQSDETIGEAGTAASAQADAGDTPRKPATPKSARRRKAVELSHTSLSSPAHIVLPGDIEPIAAEPALSEALAPAASLQDAAAVHVPELALAEPLDIEPALEKPAAAAQLLAVEPSASVPSEPEVVVDLAAGDFAPADLEQADLAAADIATAPASATTPDIIKPHSTKPDILKPATSDATSFSVSSIKDMTMDMSANISSIQDAMGQAQAKAQAAFEKSSNMLGEAGDFAKGNVEAMIESGKIFTDGVQQIGGTLVAESRTAFEAMTGDIKELAAAKSPTDFLKLQSDMVRKNFDSAVAYSSKNSETFLKLMTDMMAPLSGRVSLAVEKARDVAPINMPMNAAA